jgi:hypothetical protein
MPTSLRMEGWLRAPRSSRGPSGCPAGRDAASDLMSDLIHFLSKLVQAVRDVIRKKKR